MILHEIQAEGMALNEAFLVAVIIEKLSNGWKDVKNYLKHKRKEMSVEELVVDSGLRRIIERKEGVPPQ